MKQIPKLGSYTGTGAAIDLSLGFVPEYVEITNIATGETWKWFASMPAGSAIAEATSGAKSRINANGVSPYAGSPTKPRGFSVGTALSGAAATFAYFAIRGDD